MASMALVLLIAAFAGSASAATFSIRNSCSFTVWPAAIPVGGGSQLDPGQTWTIDVPPGTSPGRIWGRTGCSFSGVGRGHCHTGDCAGALSCNVSGQPPTTLAEFSIGGNGGGAKDFYDISLIDGFNLAMNFSCSTGAALQCQDTECVQMNYGPNPNNHVPSCKGNSNYQVIFCP